MTTTDEYTILIAQESPIFRQSRDLRDYYQRGLLSEAEYQERYQALDRAAGTLCVCKRGVVIVKGASGNVCAACYQEAH